MNPSTFFASFVIAIPRSRNMQISTAIAWFLSNCPLQASLNPPKNSNQARTRFRFNLTVFFCPAALSLLVKIYTDIANLPKELQSQRLARCRRNIANELFAVRRHNPSKATTKNKFLMRSRMPRSTSFLPLYLPMDPTGVARCSSQQYHLLQQTASRGSDTRDITAPVSIKYLMLKQTASQTDWTGPSHRNHPVDTRPKGCQRVSRKDRQENGHME